MFLVFQLDGLAETDKNLILNTLLLAEFTSRIAQGISNPKSPPDLFICLDEASRLLSSRGQTGGLALMIGLVRGASVQLDLSNQTADIDRAILSNTASKFVSRCGSFTDTEAMAAAMALTRAQRRALVDLAPGQFVGLLGDGEWRRPFLFKVPKIELAPDPRTNGPDGSAVLDEELAALPTVAAEECARPIRGRVTVVAVPPGEIRGSTLSDAERQYLLAVISHPGTPSSRLPRLAHMSPKRSQRLRQTLVQRGYLREHRVSTGKRGRAAIVLEPLQPALEAVNPVSEEG